MSSFYKTIYDQINNRAKKNLPDNFDDAVKYQAQEMNINIWETPLWKSWSKMWFEEAEKIKNEFLSEGLINTANEVQYIIEINKKIITH